MLEKSKKAWDIATNIVSKSGATISGNSGSTLSNPYSQYNSMYGPQSQSFPFQANQNDGNLEFLDKLLKSVYMLLLGIVSIVLYLHF